MTQEDYVSFETAKLLKEKGFEQVGCQKQYNTQGDLCVGYCYGPVAPTLQMAMKWLREVHKIFIEPKISKNTFLWGYRVSISNGDTTCLHANIFNKCEEACEVAIKYCLENLI